MENEILKKLDVLTKSISKIDEIEKKVSKIDEKLDAHDKRFDAIDKKFNEHDLHFRYIRGKLDHIEKTLTTHSESFYDLPNAIMNPIVEYFGKRYTSCDKRISVLEEVFNPGN